MGMFSNYEDLSQDYVPNNLKPIQPPKPFNCVQMQSCEPIKPYEEYNDKGELIGYWWYCGNTVTFEFNIVGEITIESDSIIYKLENEAPTSSTIGRIGQKAYNIVDKKSWVCIDIDATSVPPTYVWELEETTWDADSVGQGNVYIDAKDFMDDKTCIVKLYNFRREIIDTRTLDGNTTIVYNINKELADKLVRGNYYISLEVTDDNMNTTLFYQLESKLTIK